MPARLARPSGRPRLAGAVPRRGALESITACSPGTTADDPGILPRSSCGTRRGTRASAVRSAKARRHCSRGIGDGDLELRRRWFEAVGRLGTPRPKARGASFARRWTSPCRRRCVSSRGPGGVIRWRGNRRKSRRSVRPDGCEDARRSSGWCRGSPGTSTRTTSAVALALGRIGTPGSRRRVVGGPAPRGARPQAVHDPLPAARPAARGILAAPRADPGRRGAATGRRAADRRPAAGDVPGEAPLRGPLAARVATGAAGPAAAGTRRDAGEGRGDPGGCAPWRTTPDGDPLYEQASSGINLERPYAEHGRPFPVVEQIEPEQALWLLGCLAVDRSEVPEELIVPYLTSENWRERIDAAVLLNLLGFGEEAADACGSRGGQALPFGEIMGIGKSHYDTNFRDKCYLVMALAHHVDDVERLRTFADPLKRYRDIRYGLAVGWDGAAGSMASDSYGIGGQRSDLDDPSPSAPVAADDPGVAAIAGDPVPAISLPDALPFEAWHPPRGLSWPGPVEEPLPERSPGRRAAGSAPAADRRRAARRQLSGLEQCQQPGSRRDAHDGPRHAVAGRRRGPVGCQLPRFGLGDDRARLMASPYPFAHYLALREWSTGDDFRTKITSWLRGWSNAYSRPTRCVFTGRAKRWQPPSDLGHPAVGTAGPCGKSALPARPAGMGHGYPAARALARLAADARHQEVQQLLHSENHWLRTGALHGVLRCRKRAATRRG
jgi:hypothetical protein